MGKPKNALQLVIGAGKLGFKAAGYIADKALTALSEANERAVEEERRRANLDSGSSQGLESLGIPIQSYEWSQAGLPSNQQTPDTAWDPVRAWAQAQIKSEQPAPPNWWEVYPYTPPAPVSQPAVDPVYAWAEKKYREDLEAEQKKRREEQEEYDKQVAAYTEKLLAPARQAQREYEEKRDFKRMMREYKKHEKATRKS